ncbi:hypothetical protein GCM10027594_01320 [Hymenobacter agri]
MTPQRPQNPTTAAPASALRDTYDYIKKEAPDVAAELPDRYEDFEAGMQDPANINALHGVFKAKKWQGADLDADQFAAELGIKKKVSGNDSGAGLPTADTPFEEVAPQAATQPAPLGYDALAIPGVAPTPSTDERVFPLTFTGPLLAGAYQKKSDAGSVAEGTSYLSPASEAGQLNPDIAPVPKTDSFLSALGKGIANIPGDLVRVGGNALDYLGDFNQKYLTPRSDTPEGEGDFLGGDNYTGPGFNDVTDDKASDQMGAAMRAQGDKMKFQIAENARKSVLDEPLNGAAWGNLLGQGINSVAQVGAASALGGPMGGVTMGGALGISATKDSAREAGLSETEALYTATALAPIQGALEEMGMGFITKNKAVTGLLTKTIVGRALAEGGGKLSETALAKAVSSILPGVVKSAAKGGAGEAVTEFLQAEAEGIVQLTADELRGNQSAPAGRGRYGVTPFQALVKSPIEQGIGGLLVGAPASALHGGRTHSLEQVAQRQRQPEGTKPISTHLRPSQLLGRTVIVRAPNGMSHLGTVQQASGTGDSRVFIVKDANGRLSRHTQPNVWVNDSSAKADGTKLFRESAPAPAPRVDPGPTADPARTPAGTRPEATPQVEPQPTPTGPTLGELIPDATPIQVLMGDEPVLAARNAEGDIELHHVDGQVSVFDKGDQFDFPAANVLLSPAPEIDARNFVGISPTQQTTVKHAPLPANATLTIGQGEYAQTLPIEDVLRDKAGQITAVMVTGQTGSRVVDNSTPEGAAAIAELNQRNFAPVAPADNAVKNNGTDTVTGQLKNQASGIDDPTQLGAAISGDAKVGLSDGNMKMVPDGKGGFTEEAFDQEDAELELDALATRAEKGKLTFDQFQASYFGQRTDANTLAAAKEAFAKDPAAFIDSIRQAFQGTATVANVASQPIPTNSLAPAPLIRSNSGERRAAESVPQDASPVRQVLPSGVGWREMQPTAATTPSEAQSAPQASSETAPMTGQEKNKSGQPIFDTPATKRQAALDKIKARRGQQGATPGVVNEDFTAKYQLREPEPESIRETGHQALQAAKSARNRAGNGRLRPDNGNNNGGRGPVLRPDATPSETYRGKAEVSQSSISAEMREKGYASFVGRAINSIADIAEMAQVLRDPRWETFRYYFVKDNPDGTQTIVGERTLSSRMPGSTPAFPNYKQIDGQKPADWLKAELAAVGATGYYAQHNHPSGFTNPSQADLEYTNFIQKEVPGFRGHLVLNHGRYTVIYYQYGIQQVANGLRIKSRKEVEDFYSYGAGKAPFEERKAALDAYNVDPLLQPSKPGPQLGLPIRGTDDVVSLGKSLEAKDGWVIIIGRSPSGQVQAVGHLPLATLTVHDISADDYISGKPAINRGEAAIRGFARETGSPHVIIAGLPKPKGRFKEYAKSADPRFLPLNQYHLAELIQRGVLVDAVDVTGKSLAELYPRKADGVWMAPTPPARVWENIADYNGISEDDLNDFRTVLESYIDEGVTTRKELTAHFLADVGDQATTGLSDEQLRGLIREAQQAAGIIPKVKHGKARKERAHAARFDAATRKAFTADERLYTPKMKIENQATADKYIQQVGLENALAVALDKPEGFPGAAHVEVQEAVAREYRRLSDAAQKAGDKDGAARLWDLSKQARAAKVSALTDAGQTIAQVQGFIADEPDSVLDAVVKEAQKQAAPKIKQAEKAGAQVAKIATRARRTAMDAALKSPAVQKAREAATANATPADSAPIDEPKGYGQANKYFPKLTAAELKAKLRGMGFSSIVPPELVQFVGYHVESLARAGGKNSFAEVSKRVVRDLGAKVKPLLPAAYEQARAKYIKHGGADTNFTEPADVAALVAPAAVKAGIKKLGTTLDGIAREHAEGINPTGKALAERFTAEAGLDAKTAGAYAQAVEAEFAKQVAAKKSTLRNKILTFQTRVLLGKNAATAVDKLLSTLNLATDPATAADLLKAQLKLPNITKEQADEFVKLAERVRNAPAGFQRAERVQQLMNAMGKVEHIDWRDAAQAMWFANTLSGPLTHATNVVSNAHQALAETVISVAETWANTGSLKAALGPLRGVARAQRSGWAEALRVLTTGYLGTHEEKFNAGGRNYLENKTFTGLAKPLNGLKYVQRALVAEDVIARNGLQGMRSWEIAIKQAYKEVREDAGLNGEKLSRADTYERAVSTALGKLYGLPDLLAAATSQADAENVAPADRKRRIGALVNQAVQERVASWEKQAEAEGLSGIDKSMRVGELQRFAQPADLAADAEQFSRENSFNDGMPGTFGAFAGLIAKVGEIPVVGQKIFGLIAPFSRIAASVLDRHLDYTPWGFVRAAVGSHGPKEFNGGQHFRVLTPEQRSKAATRAIVGTVSALTLYGLAKAGEIIITGGYAGDKDKDEQEPEYSIIFHNGLAVPYKGWPVELQLATLGNLLAYDRRQAKKGEVASDGKRVAVALWLIAQYSASVGPSTGLDAFTEAILKATRQPDQTLNYFGRLTAGMARGMVPYAALDQQALRGFNILRGEAVKENTADTAWETAYNQLSSDIPWVRDSQEDAIGIFGEKMRLSSTRLWGWLPQERDPQDQRNLDWLAAHSLLPARKRISDDDLMHFDVGLQKLRPLTDAEFKQFMVARGHAYRDLLRAAFRKPSQAPDLDPNYKAYLLAHPEQNRSLAEVGPKEAKKWAARIHKQAVKAGKEAVM